MRRDGMMAVARGALAGLALMGAGLALAQVSTPNPEGPAMGTASQAAVAPAAAAANAAPDAASKEATGASPLYARMAATPGIGQPDGGIDLQVGATPVAVRGRDVAQTVLDPIMIGISLFVLALLGWVIVRYRKAANPNPSNTTHNFAIEVAWTLIPALILLFIAVPSFRLLAQQYNPPKADLTIKATGHQWYWSYEYPDYGDISFDAVPLEAKDLKPGDGPLHLETDNRVVVPAGATVKVLVTAADVLHSWAVPSFWVKMDAVPGRINETWFRADRPGVYYGQCSELCGTKHAFMPIAVEVLPREQFLNWVRMKQAADGIAATGPGIVRGGPVPNPSIGRSGGPANADAGDDVKVNATAQAANAVPVPQVAPNPTPAAAPQPLQPAA